MSNQRKEKSSNYLMAIEWVDEFLATKEPLIDVRCFDNHIMHNSHFTLELWKQRLLNNTGAEERSAYIRIKKFKDWYNGK